MKNNFTDTTSQTEAERLGKLYPITLAEHSSRYANAYIAERDYLLSVFGNVVVRVNHIGSTAVAGLIAKPTVDILIEVNKNTDLTAITEKLKDKGYIVNRPPNDLIMFVKGYGENGFEGQVYHIHVRELGDFDELYFRDYLISHSDIAKKYGKLKRELSKQFEHDRDGYTAAKGDFINKITRAARIEFKGKYRTK